MAWLVCAVGAAQRVQVPELNGAYSAARPATFGAPPVSGSATPIYGATPPAFDPYSMPGAGPPPASVPYGYAPPAAPYGASPYSSPAPYAPPADDWGGASPFAWEQGTYGFETTDGSTFTYQKFLQELSFEHTYLYGDHSPDALELNRLEISSTVAFPLGWNIESPLLVTPGFAFNWFEGPETTPPANADLPPRVYDAYIDTAWYPQPSPYFGAELGVRTGVWTDFNEVNADSVRVLGRGLAKFRVSPTLEVLVGAVYLDRVRVKLLPAGGFRLRPNDYWDIDLVFPYPKVRHRLGSAGAVDWIHFVAAEYGGGSWTVRRSGGPFVGPDRVDYNDIRISTGLEWENQHQVSGHFEIGVVFDRELVYASGMPASYSTDTTFMMRTGVDF
ncbi:MAG: hypothetical protein KDA37_11620 [Planctomycetales bacterium]|nr:hypothetical protein [Planctomycetales bacterium]